MLLVPGEAAELGAVEAWTERGRAAGQFRTLRAVSHARAPYALRSSPWDLVVCDLASGEGDVLALVRTARAEGETVPFVLIEPATGSTLRDAFRAQGGTFFVTRARLAPEGIARAVVQATQRPKALPRPEVRAEAVAPSGQRSVDQVPAMLFRTDSLGGFTHCSREWTRFTGRDEARERGHGWLETLHPADHSRFSEAFDAALEHAAPFQVDLRVKRAGSEYRWLRVRGVPRGSGEDGFVGSAFDVTDLVQRAAEAKRLEDDNRELRQFSYAMAHDLQEPLRALGGWLRQAVEVAPGESIEPISRALDTLQQAQHMLRDLLECTAVGSSGEPFTQTALREPLDWALANLSDQIAETGASIEVGELGSARCDAPQVARVFQNLIANSLKFRAGEAPRVRIASGRDGEWLRVSVTDNGIGIDASWHRAIFEIFKRAPGGTAAGSGVGLALCKRIVERHGGRIHVASQPGRGACFEFTLPVA